MKRQLTIALGLAVVSGSAFASKARLESLGQNADGSQYLDDHRSIFLNAASLNHHKDFVTIEVGNTTPQTAPDQDNSTNPRAEGGVFKSSGNMVYGLYFNKASNTSNNLRDAAGITQSSLMEQNSTTAFVAGDAGVQWGVALTNQSFQDKTTGDLKSNAMRTRLGVVSGDLEGFANIGIANTADNGTQKFKGKSSYDIGVTYNMGNTKYMARTKAIDAEDDASSKGTFKYSSYSLGAARNYKLNDRATLWASAFYNSSTSKCENSFQTNNACSGSDKVTAQALPVTVSLETMATDWLTLRGFIAKNVLIGETKIGSNKKTVDGLAHGVGASFKYGDLSIDGSLILANQSSSTLGNDVGTLNFAQPMNRVSLTYDF